MKTTHYIITGLALVIISMKAYEVVTDICIGYKKRIIQEEIANGKLMRSEFIDEQCKRLARR